MQPFKLIFGSTAIKYWYPDYPKEPNDIDMIISSIPEKEFRRPNTEYFKNYGTDCIIKINQDPFYVDPDLLYTIVCSHLAWEPKNGKWWKWLKDSVFLKNKGCKINHYIYVRLYREWEILHGSKSHISLNKATEMFFKDGVRREYDHDWLHEHFKVNPDCPAYKYALRSTDSPMMDSFLFKELDRNTQLLTCLEEMFVVAFERKTTLPNAYKSLVTKMSKGWWNQFLIENIEVLLNEFTNEKKEYKIKVNKLISENHNVRII